jgi:flavodoxin
VSKTIVVWFSHPGETYLSGEIRTVERGNCEKLAEAIASDLGADSFRIQEADPYPEDYQQCIAKAKADKNANSRPALAAPVPDLSPYTHMVLVYPNWWGTMPMPVRSFLDAADLRDITVAPLCSNEGSGMGSSESDLHTAYPKAHYVRGLSILGHDTDRSIDKAISWAQKSVAR